jgi:hypothetical protein
VAENQSKMHGYRNRLDEHQDFKDAKHTLARICTHLGNLEDRLTATLPQLAGNKVDSPQTPGTGAPLPQQCSFTVKIVAGLADIEITLPQFKQASTPALQKQQIVDNPNALLGTILHKLQSCSDASFSVAAGLRDYQPTSQTQILKIDANTFWRMKSSYDGKNYNQFSAVQRST